MTRRQRGTGGVECTGTHWRFFSPDGAGDTFRSPSIYLTEKDALEALAKFRLQVTSRNLVHVKGQTLAEYFEEQWRPRRLRTKAAATNNSDKSRWDAQLSRAPFAHKPMALLTRREIQAWVDSLKISRPRKPLSLLHNILESAVKDDILPSNPAATVEAYSAKADPDARYPTPEEQRAILLCPDIPRDARLIIGFAIGTGLRPGEWRSLRVADLNLNARVPFVRVRFGSLTGPTKTRKNRSVPLLDIALLAAQIWIAELPAYAPKNPHGLLFPFPDGRPRSAASLFGRTAKGGKRRYLWHDFVKAAGISRTLVPYALRHGAATNRLTVDERPAWQVQTMLGHTKLTTTQGYLHHGERELFAALGNSTVTPDELEPEALEVPILQAFEQSLEVDGGGSRGPLSMASKTTVGGNQADLNLQWSELASGTQEEAIAVLAPLVLARRESDPIERAFARLKTEHWRAALAEFIELLAASPIVAQKGGAR